MYVNRIDGWLWSWKKEIYREGQAHWYGGEEEKETWGVSECVSVSGSIRAAVSHLRGGLVPGNEECHS